MRSLFSKAFVFSTLAAGMALASTDAGAAPGTSSFSATACEGSASNGTSKHSLTGGQAVNYSGVQLTDFCPVVNDNGSASSVISARISGWSTAPGSIDVSVCRTSVSGGSGLCGATTSTGAYAGVKAISVGDLNPWRNGGPDDGYYFLVVFDQNTSIFSYSFAHS